MSSQKRLAVSGSERRPFLGAKAVAAVRPDERFEVTLRLRPKAPFAALVAAIPKATETPRNRRYLSHPEYVAAHGAADEDIAAVTAFAATYGLAVVETSKARRTAVLSGTSAAFSAAFGVTLQQFQYPGGTYRGRTGSITLPADVAPIIEAVLGLDNRPQAKPHFQIRSGGGFVAAHAATSSFSPRAIAGLYNFPTDLDGTGQCIALIELGGGFRTADIQAYFQKLGLPVPNVLSISVDHATNQPTTAEGADGEVMLDIEVAAAVAPAATIAVYFAPNTDAGFLDAITTAIHDQVNSPSVVSISWGAAESRWTEQAMNQFDQAFQAAAALGVTICCAAGDNGSGDGESDGLAHVDFPASSPSALACGGTRLDVTSNAIAGEVVWNESPTSATGGGVSDTFKLPDYQKSVNVPPSANNPGNPPGRGVPDVAGDADPQTGYDVLVDGQPMVIGGTSAVAPLWAGLLALINQHLAHRVGFLNTLLYQQLGPAGALRDVTDGSNGAYNAGPGWDACTGWGSPDGAKIVSGL
jgi:kumamolisin